MLLTHTSAITMQTSITILTQWSLVQWSESLYHWFSELLVSRSAPSHKLNQCWFVVNWTLKNDSWRHFNRNTKLPFRQNAFENATSIISTKWFKIWCVDTCLMFTSRGRDALNLNALRPRQNGPHFTHDICKCIFVHWYCIFIQMSRKFVRNYSIDNIPSLVQILAWRRSGRDKPVFVSLIANLTGMYVYVGWPR